MGDILNEQNCAEKINAYTRQDWQPLFELIPKIENTSIFGELIVQKGKDRAINLPYYVPAPIVSQFLEVVYAIPIIISFNWPEWDEGRKMASDKNFDFDSTDLVKKCKLITAIVRNDRFNEGALISAFESGLILKILKSMEKEVSGNGQ